MSDVRLMASTRDGMQVRAVPNEVANAYGELVPWHRPCMHVHLSCSPLWAWPGSFLSRRC